MARQRRLGWPITLATVMIVLIVALIIGWVLMAVAASAFAGYWWAVLTVGVVLLGFVLAGVIMYLTISLKEIGLNQRQSNFIDSVTHELKSPIASLKLYLQTLTRRSVTEEQQNDFYRFMLDDVQRLDDLINHMLDAARLDQNPTDEETADIDLAELLANCAQTACQRHRVPESVVRLEVTPSIIHARPIDIEMIFRNLIDNAIKYAGAEPKVEIASWPDGRGRVTTRVADNGPGIPVALRRKVFGRFVRLGSELERSQPGTGLGLFIVRTLVKRWQGRISVRSRGAESGTIFEVTLPGQPAEPRLPAEPADAAAAPTGG